MPHPPSPGASPHGSPFDEAHLGDEGAATPDGHSKTRRADDQAQVTQPRTADEEAEEAEEEEEEEEEESEEEDTVTQAQATQAQATQLQESESGPADAA